MGQADTAGVLDQFYTFGDVYETLDACDQLEMMLGRLRRTHFLSDEAWLQDKHSVAAIRAQVEGYISSTNLMPKGPRLP